MFTCGERRLCCESAGAQRPSVERRPLACHSHECPLRPRWLSSYRRASVNYIGAVGMRVCRSRWPLLRLLSQALPRMPVRLARVRREETIIHCTHFASRLTLESNSAMYTHGSAKKTTYAVQVSQSAAPSRKQEAGRQNEEGKSVRVSSKHTAPHHPPPPFPYPPCIPLRLEQSRPGL